MCAAWSGWNASDPAQKEDMLLKLVNFGSLNIDRVYRVRAFVRPGQTISAQDFACCAGGKGLNQSLAAARAGAQVLHAGAIGEDGGMLQALLEESGADTSRLFHCTGTATGHAVIQVEEGGQNCILVWGGANHALTEEYVDSVLDACSADDILLVQNETSCVKYILEQAAARGLRAAVNPSPIDPAWADWEMEAVRWFILNEEEGACLAGLGSGADEDAILDALAARWPRVAVVLTLGARGVVFRDGGTRCAHQAYPVKAVDTTGAGDTFCGYFLAGVLAGLPPQECLQNASRAAALCVMGAGAAPSIPAMDRVAAFRP